MKIAIFISSNKLFSICKFKFCSWLICVFKLHSLTALCGFNGYPLNVMSFNHWMFNRTNFNHYSITIYCNYRYMFFMCTVTGSWNKF